MVSSTSKPDMSGSFRSSTTQSTWSRAQLRERLGPGFRGADLDVLVAQQLGDALALVLIVLDEQQALAPRSRVALDAREGLLESLGGGGLLHERKRAAREAVMPVLVERHDLHGNVPGRRILLELAQDRPAEHVGQEDVERNRGRMMLARERQRLGAAARDQHLESLVLARPPS